MSEEKLIANKEETFDLLEIRLGKIISVEEAIDAPKSAYFIKVDFGKFGIKQTVGRFTKHTKEELKDQMVFGVLNFGTREIGQYVSEFLLLGTQYPKADSGEATILVPLVETKVGSKMF